MTLYLRLLDVVFRWCWLHVPWFADYCVEFVHQAERQIHGAILRPDVIARAREMIGK
jgi:hypothetical protein